MSWWWKPRATAPSSENGDNTALPVSLTPQEAVAAPISATAAPPVSEPVTRALSREEQAEQEWASLLRDLQAEASDGRTEKTTFTQKETGSQATPTGTDISPNSLYPTDMSCRSAFDYAMFCQSFGGQFVNVYRYGSFRSCSNHWDDFWLCMRTRKWDKADRERAIQEHYRKKAVKWKTGPSSEDVWEVRTEPVKNPISGNLAELEAELEQLKKNNPAVSETWNPAQ
ncbi:hypothetical protein CLCR_10793 [Cladophialophora carrionii]|uniref:Early meiotic induction protein 1 n=1 Tax=Cladophialophora carrionii TaxID=86049 RepID=A0A1C1CV80_9EURO|nr:hypothetical protein CLCR_10793 [Cladophialophora carrionii]